ncbi:MAG: hypothetical protein ACJ0RL_03845 [Porticoccaceae bacterium]
MSLPQVSDYTGADIRYQLPVREKTQPLYCWIARIEFRRSTQDAIRSYLSCLSSIRDKIDRVSTWGTTDGESWKNGWPIKGRTNYPLAIRSQISAEGCLLLY